MKTGKIRPIPQCHATEFGLFLPFPTDTSNTPQEFGVYGQVGATDDF
jgi:hypothetical protein